MDDRWQTILLDPFVALVDARIEKVSVDATLRPYIARFLAVRFAETRWGNEAAARVRMLTDSEVRSSASQFDSLATRLKRP
jgi:hypothetical protein